MTDQELWEWYAGKAMAAFIAAEGVEGLLSGNISAKESFVLADDMMTERNLRLAENAIPWED
jgi:hypothetical protein